MKKKRRHRRQSLAKNVALLFLSLGLLAGASMLFTSISNRSDLSLGPIQSTLNGIVSREEKPKTLPVPNETKKSAMNSFNYSFYKILNQKEGAGQTDEHYTVQIAAFRSPDRAKSFAQEIKEKSRLTCRIDREGGLSCVRWGTFTTLASAEKSREKLSEKLNRDCKVVKM
jgi:cell division septation protein DedD